MVYIELNGRLGNHLFQIATAASLANKNNCEYAVVCHDKYLLSEPDNCTIYEYIQQFKGNFFKNVTILKEIPEEIVAFNQESFLFEQIKYVDNIYLLGTFQSEKFFDPEVVRKQFKIPAELKESLQKKYRHLLSKGVTSINVRRGDYLNRPHEYNITSMGFFKKAINYIGKNNSFLVISDDIEWCKKHFKGKNFYFADNKNTPLEDLFLQTLCENNIISNSTFSWWGAWLNENSNKIVIVPSPWFSKTLAFNRTDDLIPESWIKIKNSMSLNMKIKMYKILAKKFIKSTIEKYIRPNN